MKKAFVSGEKKRRIPWGVLVPLLSFLVVAVIVVMGIRNVSSSASEERLKAMEQAVTRAAVQCYSIEGRYPPSLDYMSEHYGLLLDREHYVYHYQITGSNLMPDIRVFAEK